MHVSTEFWVGLKACVSWGMVFGLGFMAFFCLQGLSTSACLKIWVLIDTDGELRVANFFAKGLRIDSLSRSKFILAKVLLKILWGDKPGFKFAIMSSKFGTSSLRLSIFHKSSFDFDGLVAPWSRPSWITTP